MYLNTQSGLTPVLDALGSGIAARQRNDSQLNTLVNAGILPATDRPQGGFLSRLLGGAFGGGTPTPGQSSPASPGSPQGTAPGAPMPAATTEPATKPSVQPGGGGLPTFAGSPTSINSNEIAKYYGEAAQKRGIDPMTTIRVIGSEGGFNAGRAGDGGSSFGPLQLHYGGVAAGGNSVAGLGDDFTKATGLDARDPRNWKAAADFALDHVAKNGWGAFHGAAKVGIGAWDGISRGGAPVQTAGLDPTPTASMPGGQGASSQPTASAAAAPAASPSQVGETIKALIRDPTMRDVGMKLWEQTATGKNFNFHVTAAGDVIRTNERAGTADVIYRAPVKREHVDMNGRALSFDPQSGTYTDATPSSLPPNARPATAQEAEAYRVQPGTPLYIKGDGTPATLNSGTNITTNVGADPLRKAVGDRFDNSLKEADAAQKMIPAIRTARQQLQAGIISGAGANQILGASKIGAQLGVTYDPSNKVANTEAFRAAIGPVVLKLVKNLGSGSGITDADRQFAEQMAGGNITLDAASIARILDLQERAATAAINQHNAFVAQLQSTPAGAAAFKDIGAGMRVEAPEAAAPTTKTIGGVTYTQGPDGHWYTGQ